MILTPGWTTRLRRLTSTRHKCALMRVAHGDVYTNSRLFKFGLINDPKCANCDALNEDLDHRLIECRQAVEAWRLLDEKLEIIGAQAATELTMGGILGAKDDYQRSKLPLTIKAELVSRLMRKGGQTYCPRVMVKASLKTILNAEKLTQEQRELLMVAIGD